MKKLIAGNWKMNGTIDDARSLIADIINKVHDMDEVLAACDLLVCPPYIHLAAVDHSLHGIDYIALGGQSCSRWDNGAHTGNISAEMLKDVGCSYVILGHSERRQGVGETDEIVSQKAIQAYDKGLTAIICVGETEEQREIGKENDVVATQLAGSIPAGATAQNTVIAYEPVWAIGTGKTATPDDVKSMHAFIRESLAGKVENSDQVRILYGGSMKPDNAKELLSTPNVDGGLIGGASLKADDFVKIAQQALS